MSPQLESGIVMDVAISEAARSDLYTGLSQVIGPERAETLMSALPLHDLDEVATKGDIAVLGAELRSEIADLRTELKTDIAVLRTEMHEEIASLRTEMHAEIGSLRNDMNAMIGSLRNDMHSEIGSLRTEMHAEIGALRKSMTNWMLTLLVAIIGAMAGMAFIT